jgi:hypothetical protein
MEPEVSYSVHKSPPLVGSRTEEKSHCGVEVNERVDSEAKHSIKEGRDSQLLLPMADLKGFTVFVNKPKGIEEKATLKGTTGMARLRGSAR